ncbi:MULTISPECIES: phosphoribosylformylglycinamidine synthase subunit PurQ [Jonquetella]|uniref:Phosphoribosylformylglycinamidine synthase subunit PurQ n=1 Tax=Jonquetella anthropi DSM 22815 TaxID=885272 RepID=H0UM91_9BACT|nr:MULTISPECIES: phosphoribosylformylglycinamidine synthase subunit PurQ [Jonquetella]EEX48225.1 phosphoribosylformylglycinamidine synthase I [Jonquetella anthropi E3_33 E1]EHM13667.1 phosphoribosylformylglycinamidine synthase I [Jonquetella anthropi DSM 22815]ERL24384.1 phosphoribosylformylglycinamidine synthase I [Jonquetella sp. BV3C21]
MRSAVAIFPGSNCDTDVIKALHQVTGGPVVTAWHGQSELPETDLVVLPGGFSYGDYLRCGAVAAHSPLMNSIKDFAARGGLVLGICNGFQMLTETRLLPGALLQNECIHFVCKPVTLRVERTDTPYTGHFSAGQVITIPIAHNEGRFTIAPDELKRLNERRGVVLRYCTAAGETTEESNPNGATENIAGIVNEAGNVFGLMPHPERFTDSLLGGDDGRRFWTSIESWLERRGSNELR